MWGAAALFELALGPSAWKEYQESRWPLRCNPSSGNLIPIGKEGRGSACRPNFAERALSSRIFGDMRDLGVQIRRVSDEFDFRLALFNGTESNANDTNDAEDVAGPVSWHPGSRFEVGVSAYRGRQGQTLGAKDRMGYDLERKPDPRWVLEAELITARDLAVRERGWLATAGYTLATRRQTLVRREALELDLSLPNSVGRATTLGLNYFLDGHFSKRQLNYLRNDGRGHTSDDQLVLAMQTAF
ncbi:MAG: hypothetical protein HY816_08275 [Candidatus Wallbacteria bacterium]|nr:hypothetical protein [Candidatus Wallbacteria bacterium]